MQEREVRPPAVESGLASLVTLNTRTVHYQSRFPRVLSLIVCAWTLTLHLRSAVCRSMCVLRQDKRVRVRPPVLIQERWAGASRGGKESFHTDNCV